MRRTPRPVVALAAVAVLGLTGAACGSDETARSSPAPTAAVADSASRPEISGDLTVFAAASLTAAYTDIGAAFEAEHPGTEVTFNFAASSELATQIIQGAPADVYASADQANMTKLVDAGGAGDTPEVFATNSLQIIVAAGNPQEIASVADLAKPGVVFVTCAPEVPIGKYTAQVFQKAGVSVTPASFEENVKGIVTKVTLGEADAGIVYATDVRAAGGDAEGIGIPADLNVVAQYPMAVTKEAPNPDGARAFVEFVRGEDGRKILAAYGFGAP